MGKEILTRCGYRCDLCLAYKENIEKEDKRQLLSDGWFKFFGLEIEANEIYCEGCISSDSLTAKLIDDGCPVRPCVIECGYENCSQCDDFICEKLEQRAVRLENIKEQFNEEIKRTEYHNFIKPYENVKRLNEQRILHGKYSRMLNDKMEPTEDGLQKFIGNRQVEELWHKLNCLIENNYNLNKYIKFGGKSYGWELQYKKGKRTIVSIYPERKAFTVLFTLGGKELERFDLVKYQVSKGTLDLISSTKRYHDGKWIWLRVTENTQFNDALVLLEVKKKRDRL